MSLWVQGEVGIVFLFLFSLRRVEKQSGVAILAGEIELFLEHPHQGVVILKYKGTPVRWSIPKHEQLLMHMAYGLFKSLPFCPLLKGHQSWWRQKFVPKPLRTGNCSAGMLHRPRLQKVDSSKVAMSLTTGSTSLVYRVYQFPSSNL